MTNDTFALDITAEHPIDEAAFAAIDRDRLVAEIAALPSDLRDGMTGILVEGRSYSDVSQELGIRQPELVRVIQRGKAVVMRSIVAQSG
jgi:DNA-directed RNA polymerase specialized sigma24 family protein